MQRAEHVAAFLLHQQPWGDSGRILEVFSRDFGRLSLFAHGVRGARARLAGVLQPFVPLLVSWAGRGEAPRLIGAELDPADPAGVPLPPARLMSAWYVSELVMALTVRHDPQPDLYAHYRDALAGLRTAPHQEQVLRLFEKRLLEVLGYGMAELEDVTFEDPEQAQRLRPLLQQGVARCLEGRALRTRIVARSLKDLGRPQR